MNSRTVRP
ncbi:hypothetical protein D021_2116A, partial [Vibrio parahaemolyticus 10296]